MKTKNTIGRPKKNTIPVPVRTLPEKVKEVREYAKSVSESDLINEKELDKLLFRKQQYEAEEIDWLLSNGKVYIHITSDFKVYTRDHNDGCVFFPNCKTMFDLWKLMDMLNF